jgi:hypothetical protein
MFSIPGVLGLVFLTFIRPHAFIPELAAIPLLHITYVATLVGLAIDLRLRIIRPAFTPLTWWGLAYFGWCIVSAALRAPQAIQAGLAQVSICFALFFIVAHSVHSFRALRTVTILFVGIAVFLSVVGIHQGLAPKGCIAFKSLMNGTYDGRPCETGLDCLVDPEPGSAYSCEHIGLFGTSSVNLRVRWLGIIQDPNELSMCVALCLPLLIGLYLHRPSRRAAIMYTVYGLAIALCTVYTQSRGGQLVFLTAIGVYFVRRYGIRGAIVCALGALPVLLLGGRSGDEAELSKMERIEALYVAMTFLTQYPLTGVGFRQFTEMHNLTAHNSYALSAAELGFPGLYLFITLFYVSMKTFVMAAQRYAVNGPARSANIWAGALIAAQCGLMIGVFLLTFTTQPILWMFFGLCGGFYLAVRRHDPTFKLKIGLRDHGLILAISLAVTAFMFAYSRWKMAGH